MHTTSPFLLPNAAILLAFAAFLFANAIIAEDGNFKSQRIVMTRIAAPWYAPKFLVKGKMKDSIPEYKQIDGLKNKFYSMETTSKLFGGIYLFESQKQAEAWFNASWYDRIEKKYNHTEKFPILKPIFLFTNPQLATASQTDSFQAEVFHFTAKDKKNLEAEIKSFLDSFQKDPSVEAIWFAEDSNSNSYFLYVVQNTKEERTIPTEFLKNVELKERFTTEIPFGIFR